jgi:hypothetical protein
MQWCVILLMMMPEYVFLDSIAELYGEESPELDRYLRAIGEENVPPGWWEAADDDA